MSVYHGIRSLLKDCNLTQKKVEALLYMHLIQYRAGTKQANAPWGSIATRFS